jgi:hypothetical protein
MQSDILTWKMFLENFNGFSCILDDSWVSNSVLRLFTDSAGGVSKGCGIYFKMPMNHIMTEVVVMLSFFVYLLRLKNVIDLAPFHQEFTRGSPIQY